MSRNIIVISGPTACGKTSASLKLATLFEGVVVNFDSLLFYKEISIGTAKPTPQERLDVPHYMIDSHSIFSPINAADYFKEAVPLINQLLDKHKTIFLVGGSGFYLQTILHGMYDSVSSPKLILNKSDALYKEEGIEPFLNILKDKDPASFKRYHENDHYRIRRAVEHFWSTGEAFSQAREKMPEKAQELAPPIIHNWNILHIHLDIPKEEHWPLIRKRTQDMLESGVIEEVEALLENGATGKEKPLKSIGYSEVIQFLKGDISSKQELEERISISTRQLAKAQRTWFKKVDKKQYNPLNDWDSMESIVREFLGNHG